MEAPVKPQKHSGSTLAAGELPLFVWVIVFRLLVASSLGVGFTYYLRSAAHAESAPYLFAYFVILGVPSLVIAGGLVFRQRWAAWLAMTYDVLYVIVWLSRVLMEFLLRTNPELIFFFLIVLSCFVWEACALAGRLITAPRAGYLFNWAVAIAVFGGASSIIVGRLVLIHRVQPLIRYANQHWADLPKNLFLYDGTLVQDPRTGYTLVIFEMHTGFVRWEGDVDVVRFMAKDLGSGKWLIPANPSSDGAALAAMSMEFIGSDEKLNAMLHARGCVKVPDPHPGLPDDIAMLSVPLSRLERRPASYTFHSWSKPRVFRSPDSQTLYYASDHPVLLVRPQRSTVIH